MSGALDLAPGGQGPAAGEPPVGAERCPVCRQKIVVRVSDEVVIRNAILRVDPATGAVRAKCPRCKAWVEVPLRFVR